MGAGFVFHSDDCQDAHEQLAARGVTFTEPPTEQMWGTQAIFADPDGNQHLIVTPAPLPGQ